MTALDKDLQVIFHIVKYCEKIKINNIGRLKNSKCR